MHKTQTKLNGIWRLYIVENKDCKAFADSIFNETQLKAKGFTAIDGSVPGNVVIPRKQEIYAALNRCRGLLKIE